MPLHIGIVGGSAEGAALCYRTICVEGSQFLGPHAHPEVSMHTPSLAEYMRYIERGEWEAVGELMLASAGKLERMGADFLICPDNTWPCRMSLRARGCHGSTSRKLSLSKLSHEDSADWA